MKHALMVSLNIRREATQIFNKSDREVCMNNGTIIKLRWLGGVLFTLFLISACVTNPTQRHALTLNDLEYFERTGVNVLAFSSPPGGMFFDAKTSGIEVIHHGERTATNGDVRLQIGRASCRGRVYW